MFKVINGGKLPTKGSKYAACVDLYANEDITIGVGETKIVGLGVCLDEEEFFSIHRRKFNHFEQTAFLQSHYLQLMLRSSLGKMGLILPNGVGIIDIDYKDEIKMIIHNPIQEHHITWWIDRALAMCGVKSSFNDNNVVNYLIKKGDKIAQITLLEHKSYLFGISTEDERTGGFGSTDEEQK